MGPELQLSSASQACAATAALDARQHALLQAPSWLLPYRLGLAGVTAASLLVAWYRGRWLEANADRLMLEADVL